MSWFLNNNLFTKRNYLFELSLIIWTEIDDPNDLMVARYLFDEESEKNFGKYIWWILEL